MEAAEKRTRSHKRAENCFPGEDEDRVDDDGDDYDDGDNDHDGDDDAHRIILLTCRESTSDIQKVAHMARLGGM